MKLIIIEDYYGRENKFPNNSVLRSYGHKLTDLYKYVSTLKVSENKNPCDEGIICNSILDLLSDFAVSFRYYNLDLLTQGSTRNNDPLVAWKDIQNNIKSTHKKKLTKNDMVGLDLASILDECSVTFFYNENNDVISDTKDLYMQTYDNDYIQGYATLYTRKLITYLVSILIDIEYKYNIFPYLREFFEYINGEWGTDSQIRNKKSWVNM